jgi:ubiquinone/menaquinone biosynthesis C-methylase UbiE
MESPKLDPPVKKESIKEQIEDISARIDAIREMMKAQAQTVIRDESGLDPKITGDVYIESIGTCVRVDQGKTEYYYTKDAIGMRDRTSLEFEHGDRITMFEYLGTALPPKSRILNIGAGGDDAMVLGLQNAGHDVINTDFSQEAVNILKQRAGAPGFAIDLVNLGLVLPQNGVDIIMGNSTLGYLEPQKIRMVAEQLARVMDKGAVFTFDLAPHPNYAKAMDPKDVQTVVNEMDMDPGLLLANIEKFGPEKGVQITKLEAGIKAHSLECAIMGIWQKLFSEYGFKTRISMTNTKIGLLGVLRVAKHDEDVLRALDEESVFDDVNAMWSAHADEVRVPFVCIDSHLGPKIAMALGVNFDPRRLCEKVTFEIDEAMDPETRSLAMKKFSPEEVIKRLMPYIDGEKTIVEPQGLSEELMREQLFNKQELRAMIASPDYKRPLSPSEKRKERNRRKKKK